MKPGTSSEGLGTQGASTRPFPWEGFDRRLVLETYRRAYRKLTLRERRTLYLVEVEGKSYRETAELAGMTVARLKAMVFRARKKIQRRMEKAFKLPKPS